MFQHHFYFNWFYGKDNNRHWFNIGSGFFIWMFLWITLPFGIYENNLGNIFQVGLFLFPFGMVWVLISYIGDFALTRWTNAFNEKKNKRSVLLWVVKLLVLVHIIFIMRGLFCDWLCVNWMEYLQLYPACIILFGLTYVPFSLYGRYSYFHSLVGLPSSQENMISIKGDGKDHVKIDPSTIIYAQSDDNYVDFFLADTANPGRKLIYRCTLKSLMEQLQDYPQFVRIHRSIVINVNYVQQQDSRPIKNVSVGFGNFNIELPVSRSYSLEVEKVLVRPK